MSERVSSLALLFWARMFRPTCRFCRSQGFLGWGLSRENLHCARRIGLIGARCGGEIRPVQTESFQAPSKKNRQNLPAAVLQRLAVMGRERPFIVEDVLKYLQGFYYRNN